jgi:hypothetical protein
MTKEELIDLFYRFLKSDRVKKNYFTVFSMPTYELNLLHFGIPVYYINLQYNRIYSSDCKGFNLDKEQFDKLVHDWSIRETEYNYKEVLSLLSK